MEWDLTPEELDGCQLSQASGCAEHTGDVGDAVNKSLRLRRLWSPRSRPSPVKFVRGDEERMEFARGARFFLLHYTAGAMQAVASSWEQVFSDVVPSSSQWFGGVTRRTGGGTLTILVDFGAVRTKKTFELQGNQCASLAVCGVVPTIAYLGRSVEWHTSAGAHLALDEVLWSWQEKVREGDRVFGEPFVQADVALLS